MIPLKQVRVGTPCDADWEGMAGTEKVRFCGGCRKSVYNLSAMTRAEAEQTLARPDGMPCVRFHHDAIGAPLTREARPERRRFLALLVGSLLALIGMGGAAPRPASAAPPEIAPLPVAAGVPVMMGALALPPRLRRPLMGKIAVPHRPRHSVTTKPHPEAHPAKPGRLGS